MTGHIHAALMAEYAKDAAECVEPWSNWENRGLEDEWRPCMDNPRWLEACEYRRRPKTIKLGDREVNAPLRVAPKDGTTVYRLSIEYVVIHYVHDHGDAARLAAGTLFATQDDCESARLALLEMLKP